ncbi:MAG: tRNA (adenosine(37)-N6)-threonylcarbamoyltransferase complex ATPase subunit type 1 TsaE [Clostridia bacterium]
MEETLVKKIQTSDENETYNVGVEFGNTLIGGETILMFGEAGAGKTVLTKGIAKSLGIETRVTSPTFALKNEYVGRLPLHHLDMYRIENQDEAFESGALDDISDEKSVTIVEWADNVIDFFNFPHMRIYVDYLSATAREIRFTKVK